MSNEQHAQEIVMLRAEIEMLMSERQALLRATGAAAVFVANLDSESRIRLSFLVIEKCGRDMANSN